MLKSVNNSFLFNCLLPHLAYFSASPVSVTAFLVWHDVLWDLLYSFATGFFSYLNLIFLVLKEKYWWFQYFIFLFPRSKLCRSDLLFSETQFIHVLCTQEPNECSWWRRRTNSLGRASLTSHPWLWGLLGLSFANSKTGVLPLPGSEHWGMEAKRGNVIEGPRCQAFDTQTCKGVKRRTAVILLVGKHCITINIPLNYC